MLTLVNGLQHDISTVHYYHHTHSHWAPLAHWQISSNNRYQGRFHSKVDEDRIILPGFQEKSKYFISHSTL